MSTRRGIHPQIRRRTFPPIFLPIPFTPCTKYYWTPANNIGIQELLSKKKDIYRFTAVYVRFTAST